MALPVSNFSRHYDQHIPLDRRAVFTRNSSNYYNILNQTEYKVQQTLIGNIINVSLKQFFEESNFSKETMNMLEQSSNESGNDFHLAKLLEESWWNVFDTKYLRHSWEFTAILISVYLVTFFVGVIGNILVILVVCLRPRMKTVTNIFIMNLAVADLFVIIVCVGPTLIANIFQPWILGMLMCKCVAYVQGVSICASAYSLVAISLDRCYAVFRPIDRFRGISKSQALKIISLIWMIALVLILPWAVIFNIRISDKDGLAYCNENWSSDHVGNMYFLIANLIFCYILPLLIISVANAVVWRHVSNRKVPQESASAANVVKRVHQRARKNAGKMLSIATLTFLLSWLPLYVLVSRIKFANDLSEYEENCIELMIPFAQLLGSWNSCINPIIYAFLNRKFRIEFHSLLPSWVWFVRMNKLIGMGTGGYGVNISTRYSSNKYRQRRHQSRKSRNFGRINRIHRFTSVVLIDDISKSNEKVSTKLIGGNVDNRCSVKYVLTNVTTKIIKTTGTLGTITAL